MCYWGGGNILGLVLRLILILLVFLFFLNGVIGLILWKVKFFLLGFFLLLKIVRCIFLIVFVKNLKIWVNLVVIFIVIDFVFGLLFLRCVVLIMFVIFVFKLVDLVKVVIFSCYFGCFGIC